MEPAGRWRREAVSSLIKDCPVCFCIAEEREEQRRVLQLLEGELVEISGSDRQRSA